MNSFQKNEKILIIFVSGRIGDSLLSTPAIKSIAYYYSNAQITLYSHRNTLFLYKHLAFIHSLRPLSKRKAFFYGLLRIKKYSKAFIFNSINESPPIQYFNFAQRVSKDTFGYAKDSSKHGLSLSAKPYRDNEHIIEYFLRIPKLAGILPTDKKICYCVTKEETIDAQQTLESIITQKSSIIIGLQLTSFATRSYKDWPMENFYSLVTKILQKSCGVHFVIFGIENDFSNAEQICNINPNQIHNLTGLKLRPTAAIMAQLSLYIGVDTGPTHLMSSFNKPMIALYHCLFPSRIYAPLWSKNLIVIDLPTSAKCSAKSPMSLISVDTVFEKVLPYLTN